MRSPASWKRAPPAHPSGSRARARLRSGSARLRRTPLEAGYALACDLGARASGAPLWKPGTRSPAIWERAPPAHPSGSRARALLQAGSARLRRTPLEAGHALACKMGARASGAPFWKPGTRSPASWECAPPVRSSGSRARARLRSGSTRLRRPPLEAGHAHCCKLGAHASGAPLWKPGTRTAASWERARGARSPACSICTRRHIAPLNQLATAKAILHP
jgi:hypothetical protein